MNRKQKAEDISKAIQKAEDIRKIVKEIDKAIDDALKFPRPKYAHAYSSEPAIIEFICPVCESTEYEGGYVRTGLEAMGGRVYPSYYICKGCSVMFKDPKLFSKKGTTER